MKKRIKKAAAIAALGYCSVMGLGFGMLRTAQQTRRTLYGGTPVMAQVTQQQSSDTAEIMLGGGEWQLQLRQPELSGAAKAAGYLPPSMGRLLLRLCQLSDYAAHQTAETIGM